MPYQFRWYDATQHIILIEGHDKITWQDYRAIHEKICEELQQSPHRVDIIYDDSKIGFPGGNIITHLSYVLNRLRECPVLGKVYFILLPHQSFLKSVVEMAAKAYRVDHSQYVSFVSSLYEALTLIEHDQLKLDVDLDDTEPSPPFTRPS